MRGEIQRVRRSPFRFVFMIGIVSLFADTTYEGGRSIAGPFLAHLGATGFIVGLIAGVGELIGYGLRIVSGRAADRTRLYWPIAFAGYAINMLSVPALALVRAWPSAAGLLIGERFGRGMRRPAVSAMLANAGSKIGQGWVFGFHELMDQTGATIGPLVVAGILSAHGGFGEAFGVLLVPAVLSLMTLTVARMQYPTPHDMEPASASAGRAFSNAFWIYVAAGSCVAAGFADFALVSFHFSKAHVMPNHVIPILYAAAMLVGALTAPVLGRMYDRFPLRTIIVSFVLGALFAPFTFLGGPSLAIAGVLAWGLGMGAQETLMPSIVAKLTPADRRASALGTFDGVYGVAWFAGSAAMGALYDISIPWLVVLSLVLQAGALPLFVLASRQAAKEAM
jgi:MFS family permease